MEIELKYLLEDNISADKIFDDAYLKTIGIPDTYQKPDMSATYFDTEDGTLRKKEMALRFRKEGDRFVSTLKWTDSVENGLHIRGEINVPVEIGFLAVPTIEIFKESEIYETLKENIGNKRLISVMTMDFVREEVKLNIDETICALSLDRGEIITTNGNVPICEIEIELYSGEKEKILELGEKLALKYNLIPCDKSKYQRGLEKLGLV